MEAAPASPAAMALKQEPAEESGWCSLGTPAAELRLEWTLPTGQSFRWRRAGEDEWVGVVGQRAVSGASQALLPAVARWRLQSLGCVAPMLPTVPRSAGAPAPAAGRRAV